MLYTVCKFRPGLLAALVSSVLAGQIPEPVRASISSIIGAQGTYVVDDGVYKIVLPREEATIVLDYQKLSRNLGLNSWAALKEAVNSEAILTGQLLLLDDEVNPVITSAVEARLDVTGLASSSVFYGPHINALDVSGSGSFRDLATAFRKCLDEIQNVRRMMRRQSNTPDVPLESSIDPTPLNAALRVKGDVADGTYMAVIGTRTILNGEQIDREMGISTWISVGGTNTHAVAHGVVVASPVGLQPVLKALRTRGINIVSIRNHTVGESPRELFVQYWGEGDPIQLAKTIRSALDLQISAESNLDASISLNLAH